MLLILPLLYYQHFIINMMATISKKQSYFRFKEGVVREEIIKIRHKPEPRNLAGWWVPQCVPPFTGGREAAKW